MCSSSLDDALACQALLQIKLQALSSGLRYGEKDRHSRFSHPSPVTSCCREGQWRAASAVNRRGLQALNSSQICCSSPHTAPATLPPALCPYTADGTRLTASSGSDQELLDCNSLHHSTLCGSQQHSAHLRACPHQVLLQKHLSTAGDPTLALYKRPALSLPHH